MNSILLKILSTLFLLPVARVIGSQNQLILTNDCPCPGQNLTFECTIAGGGTTVWQGAQVFDCPDFFNEILLPHNNFGSSAMGECNAGSIVGRSLRAEGNCYTSQLTVEYSENLNGKNITCAHDDGFTISSRLSLMITQNMIVSFPSANNVQLTSAAPRQLTFSWDPVAPNCAAIHYNILAQNCGICPSATQHNTVVCHDMEVDQNLTCSFVVQNFRTCDGVAGRMSIPVSIMLKVPSSPTVVVIPHYSYSTREFVGLTVTFNQLDSFQISDGFDGSALSYLINFTNSLTGSSCGTATLPASSCVEGICTYTPESFTCLPLPSGINVTVSGQNVLGKGAESHPITISSDNNHFVDVDIMQAMDRIVCTFHDQQSGVQEKACRIVYGPMGSNCGTMSQSSHSFSDSVVIGLPLDDIEQEYCFSITAISGPFTAIVEGIFLKDPNATVTTHESISICTSGGVTLEFLAPIIVLILLNIVTGIIASIIIFMLVKSKQKIGLELERSRVKVKETQLPQHGLYEELDYVQMQTDSSKVVSVKHNVSYSSITDMKPGDSELPL